MENKKQTAVEFLAQRFELLIWESKNEKLWPNLLEEWKDLYIEQAIHMEQQQIFDAYSQGAADRHNEVMEILREINSV
jgi:hypothetical protein